LIARGLPHKAQMAMPWLRSYSDLPIQIGIKLVTLNAAIPFLLTCRFCVRFCS
jgi:hypothetical protein